MGSVGVIIALALLLVVIWFAIRSRARRKAATNIMQQLRLHALQATPEALGTVVQPNEPFMVMMDVAYPQAVASVVGFGTGDASIYLSNGGGILGGIEHESVRKSAAALIGEAREHLPELARTSEYPYPSPGHVRFYVSTPEGSYSAEMSESQLQQGKDSLSRLYLAAQNLITQLRLVSESRVSAG